MNELGLGFLYKLKSKTTYKKSLNTLNDRDNQNYEENEKTINQLKKTRPKICEREKRYKRTTEHNMSHGY